MYQYVKTYIENGAGYIILNDPKKLNALSQPMAAELSEVLEQFRFDPQIRVIVLRGEGGRFLQAVTYFYEEACGLLCSRYPCSGRLRPTASQPPSPLHPPD
ncbi:MAG: enoyl-CoA hydratase-related protein [Clostridium sp.]